MVEDEEPPQLVDADFSPSKLDLNTNQTAKTKVTIITGFLGAGKTTLLRHILTAEHGLRIAIIENEFGAESGIEASILSGPDGKTYGDIYEFSNGCVCCSAKGQLAATIELLMERENAFDYILVETSGLADPGPVATAFWVDDALDSPLVLDGIITVVDVKHIKQHLEEKKPEGVVNEAQRQIAYADKILINKVDLASAEEVAAVEAAIRSVNATAQLMRTSFSKIDLSAVLNIASFDPERIQAQTAAAHSHTHGSDDASCEQCVEESHVHDDTVRTVSVIVAGKMDLALIRHWLADLLWERKQAVDIFRIKGILTVSGSSTRYVLQAVHEMFDVTESGLPSLSNDENRIVFIGRNLHHQALEKEVQQCVAATSL